MPDIHNTLIFIGKFHTESLRLATKVQVAHFGFDSLSDGMVGSAIDSILLTDLAAVAGNRYNYGVSEWPVDDIVDEATEVSSMISSFRS